MLEKVMLVVEEEEEKEYEGFISFENARNAHLKGAAL